MLCRPQFCNKKETLCINFWYAGKYQRPPVLRHICRFKYITLHCDALVLRQMYITQAKMIDFIAKLLMIDLEPTGT